MIQDKLLKYDVETLINFFENQVLNSSVEQPGVYSFTASTGLGAAEELAKRVACSLRRLPGMSANAEAPPYEDPLGNREPFLPAGEAYSGVLDTMINAQDLKLDKDTLLRFDVNADNLMDGLKNNLSNLSGMFPCLGEITSVLNVLDKASPLDMDLLSSAKDMMVFEASKNEVSAMISSSPISLIAGFFKSEPTCGVESAVASRLMSPVLDKLGDMLHAEVYSSRKARVPLTELVATSASTALRIADYLKQDTLKMMDILGKKLNNPTKPQEKLASNFTMSNIIQAKTTQLSGQLNTNFPIPFGNVAISGKEAAVKFDPLPEPSKKLTGLMDKVKNEDLDTMKNILSTRVGKTTISVL